METKKQVSSADLSLYVSNAYLSPIVRDADAPIGAEHARLHAEIVAAAPLALATVLALLTDERVSAFGTPIVSAKVKSDIAFKILDRAGHVAPRALEAKGADIPLNEMSIADLRDLASQLGAEIAERARPVNAPNTPPPASEAVDSLM